MKLNSTKIPIISVTIVIALWVATPFVVEMLHSNLVDRGQFGDLYGSINALFSGLAFAGVIIAILLQRQELQLQREELAANRIELARSADAQEQTQRAMQETIYAQSFKTAVDILQSDATRAARGVILELQEKQILLTSEHWSAAERVCHTYDSVGILVKQKMLPIEFIADSWGDSLRRTWEILKPFVEKKREEKNSLEYWDDYEFLATEALKFQQRGTSKETK
jgi:hypothetical protein